MTTATINSVDMNLCVSVATRENLSTMKSHLDNIDNVFTTMSAMLCTIACHEHLSIVELLLAKDTDVNINVKEDTTLLIAIREKKTEIWHAELKLHCCCKHVWDRVNRLAYIASILKTRSLFSLSKLKSICLLQTEMSWTKRRRILIF